MNCPDCQGKTEIKETRFRAGAVKRWRYCCQCHSKFITSETFERKVKARLKREFKPLDRALDAWMRQP